MYVQFSGLWRELENFKADEFEQLGVKYVDLYLIHSPRLAKPDIPTVWKQMEKIKEDGLAKYASLTLNETLP